MLMSAKMMTSTKNIFSPNYSFISRQPSCKVSL